MRTIALAVVATFAVIGAAANQSSAEEAASRLGCSLCYVKARKLNLRSEPSTEARVLTTLQFGCGVAVIGTEEDDWVHVAGKGYAGWVAKRFLTPEKPKPERAIRTGRTQEFCTDQPKPVWAVRDWTGRTQEFCTDENQSRIDPLVSRYEQITRKGKIVAGEMFVKPIAWQLLDLDIRKALARWAYYCVFNEKSLDIRHSQTGRVLASYSGAWGYSGKE